MASENTVGKEGEGMSKGVLTVVLFNRGEFWEGP